jgi:hypothetical protein
MGGRLVIEPGGVADLVVRAHGTPESFLAGELALLTPFSRGAVYEQHSAQTGGRSAAPHPASGSLRPRLVDSWSRRWQPARSDNLTPPRRSSSSACTSSGSRRSSSSGVALARALRDQGFPVAAQAQIALAALGELRSGSEPGKRALLELLAGE